MNKRFSPSGARSLETSGFTLIETAVVMVVLAVVLGSTWSTLISTELFSAQRTRELVVTQMGWRIMDRMEELQGAALATVSPVVLEGSDWISFRKVESFSETGPLLSEPITIAYRVEPGETLNGVDDNGDGRIDEGMIEYTSGDPAVTVRIAGNVVGLRFNATTSGVEYSVVVGLTDREGEVLLRTFTERITFRN